MIGVLLLSTLTACTGLGYGDITKKNTLWKSEDGRLSFEIQGIKDYEGIGTIVTNDEVINVRVSVNVVAQALYIYRQADIYQDIVTSMFMTFDISLKGGLLDTKSDVMVLTIVENNSTDRYYDDTTIEVVRTDLENKALNAKYYVGTSWMNSNYGFSLTSDLKSDFTGILSGIIEYEARDLKIDFHFLNNDKFNVFNNDILILSGSYETSDLTMTLHFIKNDVYDNLESFNLTAVDKSSF